MHSDPAIRRVAFKPCVQALKVFYKLRSLFSVLNPLDPSSGSGGDDGTRTRGIRLAKAALSQLSYIPVLTGNLALGGTASLSGTVGLSGLEPETSPLSEARSNQLS